MHSRVVDAFGNTVRLQLLCCLYQKEKHVQELIATCGLAQSAVSQHLKKLKKAGLVKDKRKGKYIYYSLVYPQAAKLAQKIEALRKEVENES